MANEYGKLAVRLVAVDRSLATALKSAIRFWARTKKATVRTYNAQAFAAELEAALAETKVRRRRRSSTSAE
jgi:hypothetical protein